MDPVQAQNENSDHYLYAINKKDQLYFGEGIDWILSKQDNTQFYLFGEQHGISGIPRLVHFIHTKLNEKESFNLALEIDGWSARKISEEGIDKIISKYPHAIAFDYDEEIKLIKSVEKSSEIWGLDQMITAIHPYQRLIELAPNENARRLAQGIFLKASLKMGRYLNQPNQSDFEAIKEAFGDNLSEEVMEILDHLETSMNIYVSWHAGQRGELSKQISVELREQFMKNQFDAYIHKKPQQKAVFKMGGAHIIKGIGPNGVETLGNHIVKKTKSDVQSIALFNYHKNVQFVTEYVFERSNIVLLDCEKYVTSISDSVFASISDSNKSLLKGYDAIILFNNSERSKKSFVTPYKNEFKSDFIKKLSIGGILLILCLSGIIPLILFKFSKSNKTDSYYTYGRILTQVFIISTISAGIVGYQIYTIIKDIDRSIINSGSTSIWLFVILFLIAGYFIFKMSLFLKNKGRKKHKIYITLITISYLCLSYFMYYWNIGGMFSF